MQREVSPVTGCCILQADFKNRRFARNRVLHFTGRFQKSTFCP
nr:vitamin B12-binding protein [Ligilactobacillus ruminis]